MASTSQFDDALCDRPVHSGLAAVLILDADGDSEKFEVQLHEGTFKGHRIDPPSLDVHVSKNQLVEMYTQMTCVSIASRPSLTVAGRCAGWRWRPTSSTSRR